MHIKLHHCDVIKFSVHAALVGITYVIDIAWKGVQ